MNERYILGSKVNDISFTQALKRAGELMVEQGTHYIVTPNPEICLRGYKDEQLREITKQADLSIPDGFGLKIGARIQGQNLENIITGVDLSYALFDLAQQKNYHVMLIGGKGKSGTKALEELKIKFPTLRATYLNGGKFDEFGRSEYPDFISKINELKPDIILVNLGAPKQEYFMYENRKNLEAKLLIGVGGTIDFLSGNLSRAPIFLRKLGLEWVFRLIQEPSRWRRIINAVILFPLTCIWWKLRSSLFYRRSVVGMVINEQKQILLVKRSPRRSEGQPEDHWQLPQGGVEKNQNSKQAIIAEMQQEIGLSGLKILDSLPNCHKYAWGRQARLYMPYKGQRQTLFLLKFDGNDNEILPDQKEIVDFRWASKDHVLQLAHAHRKPIISIGLDKFKKYL